MIKKFIEKLMAPRVVKQVKAKFGKRTDITLAEHGINRDLVDVKAWEVVTTLKDAGYEAFIVGGAVRDLLLGLRPKDFDVATNAEPEEVKRLFKRAFIIGRRFRIVHVVYGRGREHEVIEVSTFRAHLDSADAEQVSGNEKTSKAALVGMQHAVDASGRVLRDNVWGPMEEDAARRDFTINAMYYDPETQVVVDYHKGLEDLRKKRIKMIGEPESRYREDPVRIIRAARFAAKLAASGFKIEPKTANPLTEMLSLLKDVPQSRMFDEMLKFLQTGHGLASIAVLRELGLAKGIYPLLDVIVARADEPMIKTALLDTDKRIAADKGVSPSYLLACVLWRDVNDLWAKKRARGEHPFPSLQDAIDEVFNTRIGDVSGRGKLAADMREIWMMQPRFDKRTSGSVFSLVEHLRFRAGYDFLRLRAETGEVPVGLADWWLEFSEADQAGREDLAKLAREELRAQPKAVKVAKAPRVAPARAAADAAGQDDSETEHAADNESSDAPKKRRRRRKKPIAGQHDADAGTPVAS
jgi:poly(A) polymerase